MSGIFPTFGWFSLGIKQALLYVMLADVCVEYGYEVSLYRHSAFFTIILVFFLCHCPAFLVYVIVRFFLFMSFPDALLFQSLPAPLNVISQHFPLSVVARLDRAIQQFIFWHLRLFSLSSAAFLSVICCLARRERHDRSISHKKIPGMSGDFCSKQQFYISGKIFLPRLIRVIWVSIEVARFSLPPLIMPRT